MRKTSLIRTGYAEKFRCVGSACEDTCCRNWTVAVDRPTYIKYQNLPLGALRTLIDKSVMRMPQREPEKEGSGARPSAASIFAKIDLDSSHLCPLLSHDRLCRIQTECGSDYLSHVCATYPRIVHRNGQFEEVALTLSCPEAARLVLLNPDLLNPDLLDPDLLNPDLLDPEAPRSSAASETAAEPAGDEAAKGPALLRAWFWPIRKSVVALVLNRDYPLWQRLFMLGVFCRRLDAIARGELRRSVPDFLRDFEATVNSGTLRIAMENLPIDRASQLETVLLLAGLLLHRSHLGPRFVDTIKAFTTGIGNCSGATLKTLTDQYTRAHDQYYAAFFSRHPHMLENYLINTIIRCQFPFGIEAMRTDPAPSGVLNSMEREYALLIAQFALMKGLLIGVSGFHREEFTAVHVVHTLQTASRHFEHHPEFLNMARGLLAENQMDGARGLAILLRNGTPNVPSVTAVVQAAVGAAGTAAGRAGSEGISPLVLH